jgi:hypothetical protein
MEFGSYSDSLLASPPPELTMPLPRNLEGDENFGLQIIGFNDGRWH